MLGGLYLGSVEACLKSVQNLTSDWATFLKLGVVRSCDADSPTDTTLLGQKLFPDLCSACRYVHMLQRCDEAGCQELVRARTTWTPIK